MDYEKAYNEVLKRAKNLENTTTEENALIEYLFPELKESEDERMRKELIEFLEHEKQTTDNDFDKHVLGEWIAYLERQKEQKPIKCIDFDNEFENQVSHLIASILNGEHEYSEEFVKYAVQSLLGYAKNELKPVEWSEEDEAALGDLIWCIEQARKFAKNENDMGNIWFAENWVKNRIKSLCPQPHWKPSEEQMNALDAVYKTHAMSITNKSTILKLINDLKKF